MAKPVKAMDDLQRLSWAQNRFVARRLGKAEKEAMLGEIRKLRQELGLKPLPAYNTPAFGEWVRKHKEWLARELLGARPKA